MSKRKEPTYNEVVHQIEILEAKIVKIREQTVHDFDAVLDDSMIAIMGDLSSPERRKALKLVLQNLGSCVDQVKAGRRPRSAPKIKADHTSKSTPEPAEKHAQTAANIPTAKSVDTSAQAAVKAPAGTQPAPAPKPAAQSGQAASNAPADKPIIKMPNYPLVNGEMRFNNKEQRWGVWDKDIDDWYIPIAPFGMTLEVCTNNEWYKGTLAVEKDRFGKFECISTTDASGVPFHIALNTAKRVRSVQSTQ